MKTLDNIKASLQIVEDNIGLIINDINEYKTYTNVELSRNIIRDMALYYENNPPTEPLTISLNATIEAISGEYLTRLIASFTNANKILIVHCNNGDV